MPGSVNSKEVTILLFRQSVSVVLFRGLVVFTGTEMPNWKCFVPALSQ